MTRHRSVLLSIADMSTVKGCFVLVHDFGMLFFVLKMLWLRICSLFYRRIVIWM